MRDLIGGTLEWAAERNILDNRDADRQAMKMVTEVGEFIDEVLKKDVNKARMEMGDILVTCIITSHKLGFDIEEALADALTKIRSRTGKTINGVFVKDNP